MRTKQTSLMGLRCRLRTVACFFALWLSAGSALALQGDQDLFPQEFKIGETQVVRQGVGRMRRWMITGADVALYVPEGTGQDEILGDIPRALSFYYYVSIRGEQFARAAKETLHENVDADTLARHAENIALMGSWFATVQRGDRYLLRYEPGRGTSLALNGVEKGVIPGAGFAQVYFQIWLGPNPIDSRMYAAMTGALLRQGENN